MRRCPGRRCAPGPAGGSCEHVYHRGSSGYLTGTRGVSYGRSRAGVSQCYPSARAHADCVTLIELQHLQDSRWLQRVVREISVTFTFLW